MNVFYLEANIDNQNNELVILANNYTLSYLVTSLNKLIDTRVQGKHIHLDKVSGLDGNIPSIIIQKVTDEELRKKIEDSSI